MKSTQERVSQHELKPPEPVERSLLLSIGLGWLVPGLGHFYMRKYRRGLIFFGAIITLFVIGLALSQWTYTNRSDFPFYLTGKYGSGTILIGQLLLTGKTPIDLSVHFHYLEIGVLFISVAGLLNVITILNLIDVRWGRSLLLEMNQAEEEEAGESGAEDEQEAMPES